MSLKDYIDGEGDTGSFAILGAGHSLDRGRELGGLFFHFPKMGPKLTRAHVQSVAMF